MYVLLIKIFVKVLLTYWVMIYKLESNFLKIFLDVQLSQAEIQTSKANI